MGSAFYLPSGYGGDILGGGIGAAGGFFPTPTSGSTSGSQTTNGTSTVNPNLSPDAQNLLNSILGQYSNYANNSTNLSGYQAQQGNLINQNAQANQNNTNQQLAARGLSTSPIAASISNTNNIARTGQLNNLNQSIPLLQTQLSQQALQTGNNLFSSIPKGSTTSNNSTTNSQQQTQAKSGGGIGGILSGLGSLAGLFSDERLKSDKIPMKSEDSIKLLSKLKPITFNWKEGTDGTGKTSKEPGHGFSAQAVAKVLPKSVVKDDNGFHRLDMIQVIPHLVNAVNALSSIKLKKAA